MTLDEDSSVTYNVFDASDPEFGNLLEVSVHRHFVMVAEVM